MSKKKEEKSWSQEAFLQLQPFVVRIFSFTTNGEPEKESKYLERRKAALKKR